VKKGPEAGPQSLDLREQDGAVSLRVRVAPRAGRDALGGIRDGALVVRVSAPPVEGAANQALVRFLGKALGLPASAVTLAAGERGRDKRILVRGLPADALRARLEPLASPARRGPV
jgi:uncharacterized protein (TIGR00251 family)